MDTDMSDKTKVNQPDRSHKDEDKSNKHMQTFIDKTDGPAPRQHYVDITAMIRSLQRTEGLTDCFRRGIADCDQLDCAWRQYCLAKGDRLHPNSDI
jgi:hypothetical protein